MNDKLLYEQALKDFEQSRDDALWLKSVVECAGDEVKAKLLYLKLRVEELSAISATTATGSAEIRNKEPIMATQENSGELVKFGEQISLYVGGTLAGLVEDRFSQIVKAKTFDAVLCDLYVNRKVILVTPAAKDRSSLALAGLILTGGTGALGALGMAAGMAFGEIFQNRQADGVKSLIKNLTDTIIIDASSVELGAYDYRRTWDLAGGEWETRISVKGKAIFNGIEGGIALVFAFEGKTYERSFLCKANNKVPELAKMINKPVPNILKGSKFLW